MPIRDEARWRGPGGGRSARVAPLLFVLAVLACEEDTQTLEPDEPLGPSDAGAPSSTDAEVLPSETQGTAQFQDVATGGSPNQDVVALAMTDLLQTYCAECHADAMNGPGFAGGLDLARLIESGLIVPGSSATSPLLARIRDGSMPPATPNRPQPFRPSDGDLAVLADFIDQLRTAPVARCERLPFLGLDASYAALLADVRGRPEPDRPYLRYLGIAEASNAGLCGDALEQWRLALFKLINGISTSPVIHLPVAIDEARLLFRIDLRDYGWARPIDLVDDGVVDAADGWEALVSRAYPRVVELAGPEASVLGSQTDTRAPLLSASAFVRAASDGDVYRALTGMGTNLYDWWLEIGFDPDQMLLLGGELKRAVVSRGNRSTYPRGDVIATRLPFDATGQRAYWWLDVDDESSASSIHDDPAELSRGRWTQTIWELENGLHAYSMNLADGTPIAQMPHGCVEACSLPQQLHPIACMGCHAQGHRLMVDQLRPGVEEYYQRYDSYTFDLVLQLYPVAVEFQALVDADNARYQAALGQLGIAPGTPDPVSRVYLDVDRPLDLVRAAAELGVPAALLRQRLNSLPAALAPLAAPEGSIERVSFESVFVDVLCGLETQNRPVSCP